MCRKFQTVLAQKQYMQSENILQKNVWKATCWNIVAPPNAPSVTLLRQCRKITDTAFLTANFRLKEIRHSDAYSSAICRLHFTTLLQVLKNVFLGHDFAHFVFFTTGKVKNNCNTVIPYKFYRYNVDKRWFLFYNVQAQMICVHTANLGLWRSW